MHAQVDELFSFGDRPDSPPAAPPSTKMELRPYQIATIDAVEAGWPEVDRQLIEIPTGGGKTIIFSNLAARSLPGRTLILAHQNELIEQAVDKLYHATGIIADIEKAERRASLESDVVVSSVQSMARRLDKFDPEHFQRIICDEAHLSVSAQWQAVLTHFRAKVLGVTATPDRADGKSLMAFYQRVAYRVKLFDLIKQGYLARISVRTVPLEIDVRSVGQKNGDYDAEQLDATLAPYFDKVCAAILEHGADRKWLVFLPLIKTSLSFVNACHRAGIGARHIDGAAQDRRETLQAFKDDQFQVLANASLLTTGYDEPSIDGIINLRPTRSRTLYSQCIGRGTRIKPKAGKHRDLLILDFLWQFERHVIMGPEHLIAKDEEQARRIRRKYTKEFQELDLEIVDSLAAKEKELELIEALKNQKRKGEYFDAMAFAAMTGDRYLMEFEPQSSEEAASPTAKQIEALSKLGFQSDAVTSAGQAALLLASAQDRRQKNLCTGKQLFFLRKHGVPNAEKFTRDEASAELSRIWGKR